MVEHTQAELGTTQQSGTDTDASDVEASDLHDELQQDIAERAPYANGQEYVAGPPEGQL